MQTNFRIVLVTHYFPSHRGGIEIVAGRLATELCRYGNSVEWFASDCDSPPDPTPRLRPQPVSAWNIVERRSGLPYPIWSVSGLRQLAGAIRAADIVHVHDFIYMGSVFAAAFAAWHRKPLVLTQHVGATPYDRRWMRSLLHAISQTLGRWVLGAADQVVFISDAARAYFSTFTSFRRPPLHLPNGVDTSVFRPATQSERASIRARMGIAPGRPVVAFVGRFVEHKGLSLLREISRQTPDFDWFFAGWGGIDPDDWQLPNVRVFRGLSGMSLAPLYQVADLLVLPSREGGFPLVVQEAMACGTPALVSEATAGGSPVARPLLATERLAEAGDASSWVTRIRDLLHDPESLVARRDEIAHFAANEWSWSACSDRYTDLFDTLAGGSHGCSLGQSIQRTTTSLRSPRSKH